MYPEPLFAYLSSLTGAHDLAWDCATGNGQSAMDLASFFDAVFATDASVRQLAHAPTHGRSGTASLSPRDRRFLMDRSTW